MITFVSPTAGDPILSRSKLRLYRPVFRDTPPLLKVSIARIIGKQTQEVV